MFVRNTPPASPGNVCCQQVVAAANPIIGPILSTLGIILPPRNDDILIGLTCTDVTVIGNSATWYVLLCFLPSSPRLSSLYSGSDTTEVFCQDNSHDPLISIDCVPVTL
jgi:hypothetical protein